MIARNWHGTVPVAKSDRYLKLMRTVAIPDYRRIAGNKAALVLHRREGELAHFITFTLWDSEDAIREFAGEDMALAKYYDFDSDFLTELEPTVRHYDVYDA